MCIYIGYPLVLNFSPSFPCNRPLKTAIWKKWKRKYGLRNEKDEEMWIKIPQKKMWKKLRRDEVALLQRNCHQTPPNWQSRWMPSSILWSTTKTGEYFSPSPLVVFTKTPPPRGHVRAGVTKVCTGAGACFVLSILWLSLKGAFKMATTAVSFDVWWLFGSRSLDYKTKEIWTGEGFLGLSEIPSGMWKDWNNRVKLYFWFEF